MANPAGVGDVSSGRPAGGTSATFVQLATLVLAGVAMLAQLLDLVTFLAVVAVHGIAVEVNPVARALYARGGPAGVAAVKLLVALVVPVVLAHRAQFGPRPALARTALVAAIGLGVLGFHSNLTTFDRMAGRWHQDRSRCALCLLTLQVSR